MDRNSTAIQVVLASARHEDRESLHALLAGTPWELVTATSLDESLHALRRVAVPLILCDQELEARPWQRTLHALTRARRRTYVIVVSSIGGRELSMEVGRKGGFDMLTRPFERDQVYPTLMCAYAQYRSGLARPFSKAASPANLCVRV